MIVEQSYQRLLNNRSSDCWTILPVTVEQLCQWLLNNCASDRWTIVPATVEQYLSLEFLLLNLTSKYTQDDVCSEVPFSQLLTITNKLSGFSKLRFLLKHICEQTLFYCWNRSVELQCKSNDWFPYSASFYWKVFLNRHCGLFVNIFSKKNSSYHKETSQLICNTNSMGFSWETFLRSHLLVLIFPFCKNVLHSYTLN